MSSGPPPPTPTVVNPTLGKDREKLPGWNDPPELSGNSRQSSGSRIRLNKRVGFPTGSTAGPSVLPPPPMTSIQPQPGAPTSFVLPLSTPPIVQAHLPPPPQSSMMPDCTAGMTPSGSSNVINPTGAADDAAQPQVPDSDAIIELLSGVMDAVGSGPDIKKRVALMQSKWPNLDEKVKLGVVQMAKCLAASDHDGADRAQRELAVNHSSHCSGWIVAFKRLIADSRTANQGDSTKNMEAEEQKTGYMVPANQ